ncbi:MAG: hypothetical protein ABI995_03605 [Acidobacteriota bacterium]
MIQLEWRQRDSDYPFRATQLSDGTLRFICLATVLLQAICASDGAVWRAGTRLHPYALTLLGNLFKQFVKSRGKNVSQQAIVSTQSAALLNEFTRKNVIIVERANGQSRFRRLQKEELPEWLQEYSLAGYRFGSPGPRPLASSSRIFFYCSAVKICRTPQLHPHLLLAQLRLRHPGHSTRPPPLQPRSVRAPGSVARPARE